MDKFEHKLKSHVRDKMAKHKKIKKHAGFYGAGRPKIWGLEDELTEAEVEREKEQSLHDLVCKGMQLLFPNAQDIIERLNKLGTSSEAQDELNSKCVEHIENMEIQDLEDLVYFIDLVDRSTGAWWWHNAKPMIQEAVYHRLSVLAKEKEDDDET